MEFIKKYNLEGIDKVLLNVAFTHSSYSNEHGGENYERLEFLGDAVMQLIMSDYYYNHTNYAEGQMSKERASYVCESALAFYSQNLGLKDYIKTGEGQKNNINDTIVADVFEAVVGSIYLSLGYNKAKEFIDSVILPHVKNGEHFFRDYKSLLQEMIQTTRDSLEYVLVNETGPAHDKTFEVNVVIDGMVFGTGIGKTKKEAEQNAALSAYKKRAKM